MLVFNLLVWLAVGALMGWLVSRLARVRGRSKMLVNFGVGMLSALLAGVWIAPLVALPEDAMRALPSLDAMAVTSLGAAAVLIVVNAVPILFKRRHPVHR